MAYFMLFAAICVVLQTVMMLFWHRLYMHRIGEWLLENNKIPAKSFLRKLYPFKKEPKDGLLYITFIPVLISVLIFFAVLIIYACYWIKAELLSDFLESGSCLGISLGYMGLSLVYGCFVRW